MKSPKVSKETRRLLKVRTTNAVDIGAGANKNGADFFGIDYRKLPGIDLVQDLESFPWPIPTDTFKVGVCSHVVEHINPSKGIFINFMNSVWRILKPGAEFFIAGPYATSPGMFRDPTHCNFINEETWAYFSPNDVWYHGGLYRIYAPLPWKIKVNTWNPQGSFEVVLIKIPIKDMAPGFAVDPEYLRILKEETKMFK